MKKTFAGMVNSFLKSLGSDADPEEKNEEPNEDDLENQEESGDEGEDMQKSNADDLVDATDVMRALVSELQEVNKSLAALAKRQDGIEKSLEDIGEATVGVADLVSKVANSPLPKKTVMAKGGLGNDNAGGGDSERLTVQEFNQAQIALTKACKEGRITIHQAGKLETEMQKALNVSGYRMDPADAALIARELKTA